MSVGNNRLPGGNSGIAIMDCRYCFHATFRWSWQSRRMRYQAHIDGVRAERVAQLALLIAIINVAACLIADRAIIKAGNASIAAAARAAPLSAPFPDDREKSRLTSVTVRGPTAGR